MNGDPTLTYVRPRMGTLLAVTLRAHGSRRQPTCVRRVFDLARALEEVVNRHSPHSALSRFNRSAGRTASVRSAELARVLRRARELSRRTEGAFDPTVGPLVELWQRASPRGRAPSRRQLQATRSRVGWQGIEVKGPRVWRSGPGVAVDLDGIGKGVALDRIASTLKRSGAVPALLNFGESSLLAVGRGPGAGWRVLLRHPLGGFVGEFLLRNGACSTSATLGRRATVEGRTIGHILDPRTGRPLQAAAQAVVLARSAAVAEAVSTALLILGRRSMDRLARRLRVEACWIDRSGIRTTRGFVLRKPSIR